MVVDSPEVVRRQAIPLGHRAWEAIAVLVALVVMLVGNWFPAALVAVICSVALVLLRVLTVPQAYKGIDWNTCILVGGMIPLATAMRKTGAAELLADYLIHFVGDLGPRAILAGLFLVTFALTSVMSNTAAALVMLPIAVATGVEMGVSPMALIIGVTVGAHAALLTPVATPVNLMVVGPGGVQVRRLLEIRPADRDLVARRRGLHRARCTGNSSRPVPVFPGCFDYHGPPRAADPINHAEHAIWTLAVNSRTPSR